jgi:hypothetical protein
MGEPILQQRVTPLVAMLAADPAHFDAAQAPLEALLGPVELRSPYFPFNPTEYYTPTMGANLMRCFFSFHNFADASALPDWKLASNALEARLAPILAPTGTPPRPINIDPGYVTGAKLVLATTKDFAHRIYMRDGIFAEITMAFRRGVWLTHQFTFPDFKSGIYDKFLRRVRDNHLCKSRTTPKPN